MFRRKTARRGASRCGLQQVAAGVLALGGVGVLGAGTAGAAVATTGRIPAPTASASLLSPRTAAACSSVPSTRNLDVTAAVYGEGRELGVSSKVMLAGFEAGWVESHLNNLLCGDQDSLGVFQQRPSQGWGTPEQILDVRNAAHSFFTRAKSEEARCYSCTAGQLAQRVQRSSYPDRYDEAQSTASSLLSEAAHRYAVQPYDAVQVCGDGFRIIDKQDLSGQGAVYLLWKGSVTQNCVVTLKTSNTSTPTPTSAQLQPDGATSHVDSGSYRYYAGPVRLPAPGCVRWGGSIGSARYLSGREHCG